MSEYTYEQHVETLTKDMTPASLTRLYGADYANWKFNHPDVWADAFSDEYPKLISGDFVFEVKAECYLILGDGQADLPEFYYYTFMDVHVGSLNSDMWKGGDDCLWCVVPTFGKYLIHRPTRKILEKDFAKKKARRPDYCYSCQSENLYWHVMTAKCSSCHSVILGGV